MAVPAIEAVCSLFAARCARRLVMTALPQEIQKAKACLNLSGDMSKFDKTTD